MNFLDQMAAEAARSLVHKWLAFDLTLLFSVKSYFLRGGAIMAFFWYQWFAKVKDAQRVRRVLLQSTAVSILAVLVVHGLSIWLPFRNRPLHNQDLNWPLPFTINRAGFDKMSSFPSDHAALFVGIAFGIYLASRRRNIYPLIFAALFICFPRMILGLHYFTDILAGAAISVVLLLLAMKSKKLEQLSDYTLSLMDRHPGAGYCIFFLVSLAISTIFDEQRYVLSLISQYMAAK